MIKIHYLNNGRYCSSRDLHKLLGLKYVNYSRDVKKWLTKYYLFQGKRELTKPIANYDYILFQENSQYSYMKSGDSQSVKRLHAKGNFADEFMIRLELVKLITLDGRSKIKNQFIQWLLSLEEKVENHELVSPDLIFGLLELAKLCTYMDRQIQYYKEHKKTWLELVEDNRFWDFDVWRNKVLQIPNADTLRNQYKNMVRIGNLISKREQENSINPYQGIRDAIFDFLKVQYNQIDYYYPESTERSLTLANMTQRILQLAGGRPDIKQRGYTPSAQQDFWRKEEDEPNIELVSGLITKNIIASIQQ